jgi:pimeloyl-ACP methyl ester carboxylesterase
MIANTHTRIWRGSLTAVLLLYLPLSEARSTRIEEARFVPIGGIDQWITINGQNRSNPIVLFLHGGPGDPLSPYADAMYGPDWQREFTLVQWDQRGAGRTYGKSGPSVESTMTVDRMVDDGIEVAEFLIKHLHQKKVIIVGGSWGSILGISMAKTRPDLFYAYVGTAQVVSMREDQAAGYVRVLALAQEVGDQRAIGNLVAMGPPPWDTLRKLGAFLRQAQVYEAKTTHPLITPLSLSTEYADAQDRADYTAGEELSFVTFFGPTVSGPLMQVDLLALGTSFSIPIFIIQGQDDLRAPEEVTKAYFDRITAPRKQFFIVPGSGHEPSQASSELMLNVLVEKVRSMTSAK